MRPLPTLRKRLFITNSELVRSFVLYAIGIVCVVCFSNSSLQGQSTIQPARADWDTGWFQTEVYRALLQDLGYDVDEAMTMGNQEFYNKVSAREVDFWANAWIPLHQTYIKASKQPENIALSGRQVQSGAVQGYMIDKRSAEELNITSLTDFERPEVQQHFDTNNDGTADLAGCDPGWGCEQLVEYQLSDLNLTGAIDHQKGPYSLLMQNIIKRYQQGDPVFFFTWTPNWTIGALKPGEDVVWLELPGGSVPGNAPSDTSDFIIDKPPGSQRNLLLGSPANDILVAANQDFLNEHPDISALFEQIEIPLEDILDQNARLLRGESDLDAIKQHASEWIDENSNLTDRWVQNAKSLQSDPVANTNTAVLRKQQPSAGDLPQKLTIVTQPVEPFVIYQNGTFGGFTIDFLNMVCEDLNIEPEYYAVNSLAKLTDELERGQADIGAAAITITSEREQRFDLTHSYFDTGLQIMVLKEETSFLRTTWTFFKNIFGSEDLWFILGFFVVVLFVIANIIWLIEHKRNPDFPSSYFRGIFVSLWWSAVTVTTVGYGDKIPRRIAGKAFAMFWLFSGYFIFAYFTATVTSSFTVSELDGRLRSPNDLYGHTIITVNKSAADAYLNNMGISPVRYGNISTAVNALKQGEGDAIVYDAPVLQYYVRNDRTGSLQVSGVVFEEKNYGIVLPENTAIKNELNQELLRIQEDGRYQRLYQKWFGNQR